MQLISFEQRKGKNERSLSLKWKFKKQLIYTPVYITRNTEIVTDTDRDSQFQVGILTNNDTLGNWTDIYSLRH